MNSPGASWNELAAQAAAGDEPAAQALRDRLEVRLELLVRRLERTPGGRAELARWLGETEGRAAPTAERLLAELIHRAGRRAVWARRPTLEPRRPELETVELGPPGALSIS